VDRRAALHLLARWSPVVAWMAVIWTLSSGGFGGERTGGLFLPLLAKLFPDLSPAVLEALHVGLRKLAHFAEYLVLSVLLHRALHAGPRWSPRAAATAIVVAALYAAADEVHQSFVPGRTASAADWLVDVAGAAGGQAWLSARSARATPRRSPSAA
jgi:VanZ family protein